jgi:hypothetical protein
LKGITKTQAKVLGPVAIHTSTRNIDSISIDISITLPFTHRTIITSLIISMVIISIGNKNIIGIEVNKKGYKNTVDTLKCILKPLKLWF